MRRRATIIGTVLLIVMLGTPWIGHGRTNPPVDPAVRLEAGPVPARVAALLQRACYDCHSSETRWPWYAYVAPSSWLVTSDVDRARKKLSFSRWARYNVYDRADLLDKVCDVVSKHQMPLRKYRWLHPRARLSERDVAGLCAWTQDEAARLTRSGG